MEEQYCEYVTKWGDHFGSFDDDPSGREFRVTVPDQTCDKPARFQTGLGHWYCAEHWDIHIAEVEELAKRWEVYDQGICGICNCEFHNGECNCQYYTFG